MGAVLLNSPTESCAILQSAQAVVAVAVIGTPVALGPMTTFFRKALIWPGQGRTANTGTVFLGSSSVDDTQNISAALAAGAAPLQIDAPAGTKIPLGSIYLDALNANDGVTVMYWY
jgi:hypothetical protein